MSNVKVTFKLDSEGVGELLKGKEVQDMINEIGQSVANTAGGSDYSNDVKIGKYRAIARVKPTNARAYYSNKKHNTLLKALKGASL